MDAMDTFEADRRELLNAQEVDSMETVMVQDMRHLRDMRLNLVQMQSCAEIVVWFSERLF